MSGPFGSQAWAYASGEDYDIPYSCRFNDDDTAYLSKTLSSGNRKTWTWSGWIKRGNLGSHAPLFSTGEDRATFRWNTSTDVFRVNDFSGDYNLITDQVFRDIGAWMHIVVAMDTTQGTAANRLKLYINGLQVTDFSTETYPSQNLDTQYNLAQAHYIGTRPRPSPYGFDQKFDGYLADVHFIDGTALTPTSFGETGGYGEWKAKKYSGSYGTNGFYLDFSDSAALGDDAAGSNDFAVNNLVASDQMLDTPTNNFAIMMSNIKDCAAAFREGNLEVHDSSTAVGISSIQPTTGKWYWEADPHGRYSGSPYWGMFSKELEGNIQIGDGSFPAHGTGVNIVSYSGSAFISAINEGTMHGTTGPWPHDYVWGFAMDCDNGKLWISRNGDWTHVLSGSNPSTATNPCVSGLSSSCIPFFGPIGSTSTTYSAWVRANFGQDGTFAGNQTSGGYSDDNDIGDFKYEPPTDFLALCSKNLSDPAIIPSEHFNSILHSTANGHSHTGVGFQPDLIWSKSRSNTYNHGLFDSVRGANKWLRSDANNAEVTPDSGFDLLSFDTDGFTVGNNQYNTICGGGNYVVWNWKANGSGSANTNGSTNSVVSVNTDAGFSIVSWDSNGSNATIGHGLSKAPEMIILKEREESDPWHTYHKKLGNTAAIYLSSGAGADVGYAQFWNNTSPTATVFTVSGSWTNNDADGSSIAYCFHSVDGYSKVGAYKGNTNADGTFIYCGFRPAFFMWKRTDWSGGWGMIDSARDPFNEGFYQLGPDDTDGDGNYSIGDFVSNGMKMRNTFADTNVGDLIFIAFAETPFKYTNAR